MFASVVIPTWNRAALLPACLTSLAEQDAPRDAWELIVVDDGSEDDTPAVVALLQEDLLRAGVDVSYVRRPHEGLNAARNAGLATARGDLICFLDDDVRVPRGWLSELLAGVRQNPGAAAYGGPILLQVEGRVPRSCGREELGETIQDCGPDVCEPPTLFGSNLTLTRNAVTAFGTFNEDIVCGGGDETEWLVRARAGGGRLLYLPGPAVYHLRRAEDVRLRRLLARRFDRGRAQVHFGVVTEAEYSARAEARQLCRSLAHSATRRCAMGLLPVATSAGRLTGLAARRLTRPRGRRGPTNDLTG